MLRGLGIHTICISFKWVHHFSLSVQKRQRNFLINKIHVTMETKRKKESQSSWIRSERRKFTSNSSKMWKVHNLNTKYHGKLLIILANCYGKSVQCKNMRPMHLRLSSRKFTFKLDKKMSFYPLPINRNQITKTRSLIQQDWNNLSTGECEVNRN